MAGGGVPVKTAEGQVELDTRRRGLSQRHRTVLLLVDGRRTEAEVREMAAQAGASPACFDELRALGLIAIAPAAPPSPAPAAPTGGVVAQRDPAAHGAPVPLEDSLLPSVRSLPPDTTVRDSVLGGRQPPDSWLPDEEEEGAPLDEVVEQARTLLVRAVRQEAPLAGTLTVLRLRRARTRRALAELLDEVEARLGKRRSLALSQTLASVRRLLESGGDAVQSAA